MKFLKVISVIGYSGSGKTYLILNAIKLLQKRLGLNSSVIKNIHEHRIDSMGKDSYTFTSVGAQYSIVRNKFYENVIFINKDISIQTMIKWLQSGPLETDVFFLEGFRGLNFPTILCVEDSEGIKQQLTKNIKMISGMICSKKYEILDDLRIPIIDIVKEFTDFIKIFKIG